MVGVDASYYSGFTFAAASNQVGGTGCASLRREAEAYRPRGAQLEGTPAPALLDGLEKLAGRRPLALGRARPADYGAFQAPPPRQPSSYKNGSGAAGYGATASGRAVLQERQAFQGGDFATKGKPAIALPPAHPGRHAAAGPGAGGEALPSESPAEDDFMNILDVDELVSAHYKKKQQATPAPAARLARPSDGGTASTSVVVDLCDEEPPPPRFASAPAPAPAARTEAGPGAGAGGLKDLYIGKLEGLVDLLENDAGNVMRIAALKRECDELKSQVRRHAPPGPPQQRQQQRDLPWSAPAYDNPGNGVDHGGHYDGPAGGKYTGQPAPAPFGGAGVGMGMGMGMREGNEGPRAYPSAYGGASSGDGGGQAPYDASFDASFPPRNQNHSFDKFQTTAGPSYQNDAGNHYSNNAFFDNDGGGFGGDGDAFVPLNKPVIPKATGYITTALVDGSSNPKWKRNDFPWSAQLMECNRTYFGYSSFRKSQEEIMNATLSRHDVFALMPTGGGKSLTYQLPALCEQGVTVVISPLVALIQDQIAQLRVANIDCGALGSTTDEFERHRIISSLRENPPGIRLLYVTPEKIANSGHLLSIFDDLYVVGISTPLPPILSLSFDERSQETRKNAREAAK